MTVFLAYCIVKTYLEGAQCVGGLFSWLPLPQYSTDDVIVSVVALMCLYSL